MLGSMRTATTPRIRAAMAEISAACMPSDNRAAGTNPKQDTANRANSPAMVCLVMAVSCYQYVYWILYHRDNIFFVSFNLFEGRIPHPSDFDFV
jgi:hypothetical protein